MGAFLSSNLSFTRREGDGAWQLDPAQASSNAQALHAAYSALIECYAYAAQEGGDDCADDDAAGGATHRMTQAQLEARVLLETAFLEPLPVMSPLLAFDALRAVAEEGDAELSAALSDGRNRLQTRLREMFTFAPLAPLAASLQPSPYLVGTVPSETGTPRRLVQAVRRLGQASAHAPSTVAGLLPADGPVPSAVPACVACAHTISQVPRTGRGRASSSTPRGGAFVTVCNLASIVHHIALCLSPHLKATECASADFVDAADARGEERGQRAGHLPPSYFVLLERDRPQAATGAAAAERAQRIVADEFGAVVNGILLREAEAVSPPLGTTKGNAALRAAPRARSGAEAFTRCLFMMTNTRGIAGMSLGDLQQVAQGDVAGFAYHTLRGMLLAPYVAAPAGVEADIGTGAGGSSEDVITASFARQPSRRKSSVGQRKFSILNVMQPGQSVRLGSRVGSMLGGTGGAHAAGGRRLRDPVATIVRAIRGKITGRTTDGGGQHAARSSPAFSTIDTPEDGAEASAGGGNDEGQGEGHLTKDAWAALLARLQTGGSADDKGDTPAVRSAKHELQGRLKHIAAESASIGDGDGGEVLYELVEDALAEARRSAAAKEDAESHATWEKLCAAVMAGSSPSSSSPGTSPTGTAGGAPPAPSVLRKQSAPTTADPAQSSSKRRTTVGFAVNTAPTQLPSTRPRAAGDTSGSVTFAVGGARGAFQGGGGTHIDQAAVHHDDGGDDDGDDDADGPMPDDDLLVSQRTLRAVFFLALEKVDLSLTAAWASKGPDVASRVHHVGDTAFTGSADTTPPVTALEVRDVVAAEAARCRDSRPDVTLSIIADSVDSMNASRAVVACTAADIDPATIIPVGRRSWVLMFRLAAPTDAPTSREAACFESLPAALAAWLSAGTKMREPTPEPTPVVRRPVAPTRHIRVTLSMPETPAVPETPAEVPMEEQQGFAVEEAPTPPPLRMDAGPDANEGGPASSDPPDAASGSREPTVEQLVQRWERRRQYAAAETEHLQTVVRSERKERRQATGAFLRQLRSGEGGAHQPHQARSPARSDAGGGGTSPGSVPPDCDAIVAAYESRHPEMRRRLRGVHDPSDSDDQNDAEATGAATSQRTTKGLAAALEGLHAPPGKRKPTTASDLSSPRQPSSPTRGGPESRWAFARSRVRVVGSVGVLARSVASARGRSQEIAALVSSPWRPPDDVTFTHRLEHDSGGAHTASLVPYGEQALVEYAVRALMINSGVSPPPTTIGDRENEDVDALPVKSFAATESDEFMRAVTVHDLLYLGTSRPASSAIARTADGGIDPAGSAPSSPGGRQDMLDSPHGASGVPPPSTYFVRLLQPPRGAQRAAIQHPWIDSLHAPRTVAKVAFALTCLQDVDFRGKPAQRRLAKLDGHRVLLECVADVAGLPSALRARAAHVLVCACRDRRTVVVLRACDVEVLLAQRIATLVGLMPQTARSMHVARAASRGADPVATGKRVSSRALTMDQATELRSLFMLASAIVTPSLAAEKRFGEACQSFGGLARVMGHALALACSVSSGDVFDDASHGHHAGTPESPAELAMSTVVAICVAANVSLTTRCHPAAGRQLQRRVAFTHPIASDEAVADLARALSFAVSALEPYAAPGFTASHEETPTGGPPTASLHLQVAPPGDEGSAPALEAISAFIGLLGLVTRTTASNAPLAADIATPIAQFLSWIVPAVPSNAEVPSVPSTALVSIHVPASADGPIRARCSDAVARAVLLCVMALAHLADAAMVGAAAAQSASIASIAVALPRLHALLRGALGEAGGTAAPTQQRGPASAGRSLRPVVLAPYVPPLPNIERLLHGRSGDDDDDNMSNSSGGGGQSVAASKVSFDAQSVVTGIQSSSGRWDEASAAAKGDGTQEQPYAALDGYLPTITFIHHCTVAVARLAHYADVRARTDARAGATAAAAAVVDEPLMLLVAGLDEHLFPLLPTATQTSAEVRGMPSPLWRSANAAREHALAVLADAVGAGDWLRGSRDAASLILRALKHSGDVRISCNAARVLAAAAKSMGTAAASIHPDVLPALAGLLRRGAIELQHPAAVSFANILDAAHDDEIAALQAATGDAGEGDRNGPTSDTAARSIRVSTGRSMRASQQGVAGGLAKGRAVADEVVDLLLPHCGAVLTVAESGRPKGDGRGNRDAADDAAAVVRSHDACRLVGCLARHSHAVAAMLNQRDAATTIAAVVNEQVADPTTRTRRPTKGHASAQGAPPVAVSGGVKFAWVFFAVNALLERSQSRPDACTISHNDCFLDAVVGTYAARRIRPDTAAAAVPTTADGAGSSAASAHEELLWGLALTRTLLRLAPSELTPRLVGRGAVVQLSDVVEAPAVHPVNKDAARDVLMLMRDERHAARGHKAPAARPPPSQPRPLSASLARSRQARATPATKHHRAAPSGTPRGPTPPSVGRTL